MEQLLSETEVAERLQVPLTTLKYWRAVRSGPAAIKVGRYWRYRPSTINGWLDSLSMSGGTAA